MKPLVIRGLVLSLFVTVSRAEGPDHAIVAGFERFAKENPSAEVGKLLIGDLNCLSCHSPNPADRGVFLPKQAPILDGVGARVKPDWIRRFLAKPQAVKPGTTMPDALASLPEAARSEAIEDLTHFFTSTGRLRDRPIERNRVPIGSELYHQIGCAVCHGPRDGSPIPAGSVPLPDLVAKYSNDSLSAFLREPHAVRPSGRMPSLSLDDNQAGEIVNFLRKDASVQGRPSLSFRVYPGNWTKLPDLDALKPEKEGTASGFDLTSAGRANGFAMRFDGFLQISVEKDYTFFLTSDDGSKLWIDGKLVADNDNVHPAQTAKGLARLSAGPHRIRVDYFDGAGQIELSVDFEAKEAPRQSIEAYLSLSEKPPVEEKKDPNDLTPLPERVERGRALFASVGCASCHQLRSDGQPIASKIKVAEFARLKPDVGCLAEQVSGSAPRFALDAAQRRAIGEVLAKPEVRKPPEGRAAIERSMLTWNCYACHSRDGIGGPEDARKPQFVTVYQDLGDEGRYPPHLNGVGAKIQKDWLAHVLNNGAKDRPYMKTRMPNFGGENVGDLVDRLIAADPKPEVSAVRLELPEKKLKSIGRHLVGTQAFGCVQCHNFRGEQSTGIPAIDMAIMTRRLNHDWFVKYVTDPQAYRPGTRMPASWPMPQSQLTEILDGRSRDQIEAVWTYLSDGGSANPPYGIGRSPIPLKPGDEAILYRGFVQGAGTRGISVGFPEKINFAFDANEGRLAVLWKNDFIDAAKHWMGRGEGFQVPLGDDIFALKNGSDLAFLEDEKAAWPIARPDRNDGFKFRGYRLSKDRRPTFLYSIGGVSVEDAPDAVKSTDGVGLRRVLRLRTDAPVNGLFYRVAVGDRIEPGPGGTYTIDGELRVRVQAARPVVTRNSQGRTELLIPVEFANGRAEIVQEYRW